MTIQYEIEYADRCPESTSNELRPCRAVQFLHAVYLVCTSPTLRVSGNGHVVLVS